MRKLPFPIATFILSVVPFVPSELLAQKPQPPPESKGTVEFWQRELPGKSKKDVKALLGTPFSIAEEGAVYHYPDEFFHPDLEKWRTLMVRFSDQDLVESFSGGEDSKTYQVSASTASPPAVTTSPIPDTAPKGLAEGRRTALEIAEYFKNNRDRFEEYRGRGIEVSGVVDSLRLENSRSARIFLRTSQGLPKVALSYELGANPRANDESELRLQGGGKTIEWRPYRDDKWRPLLAVGRELGATGSLTGYHINVEISVDSMKENL